MTARMVLLDYCCSFTMFMIVLSMNFFLALRSGYTHASTHRDERRSEKYAITRRTVMVWTYDTKDAFELLANGTDSHHREVGALQQLAYLLHNRSIRGQSCLPPQHRSLSKSEYRSE